MKPSAWRVGILTCSTSAARGHRRDVSGKTIKTFVRRWWKCGVSVHRVVPDRRALISRCLKAWSRRGMDVVFTTGGTGLSPTDVTPEATRAVIDREAPGIAEAMRASGSRHTLFSWLSRAVAGSRGKTLIINLPGSPQGVRQGLSALRRIIPHAVDILSGGRGSHDTFHRHSRRRP